MRLKKFTPARTVPNLIRKVDASWDYRLETGKRKRVMAFLFPDGRFTNAEMWLELPQVAVNRATARQDKLGFHTTDLPNLDKALAHYRKGEPHQARLLRFYYDGMGWDQKAHRWYAEFAANGKVFRYNADYVLALEYAAGEIADTHTADGVTITTKRINIDKWLVYEGNGDVLEAWNGRCIGGVVTMTMP